MKTKTFIIILFSTIILSEYCSAQGGDKIARNLFELPARLKDLQAPKKELTNKVLITNKTGIRIRYSVSPDIENWDNVQVLEAGYEHTYTSAGFNIKIQTDSKAVQYYLTAGYSYSIQWNYDKKLWDIYLEP